MSKLIQNIVTKRFLDVLDELLTKQLVKNDSDFCKRSDFSLQSLGQIRAQKRNVTIELVSKLITTFNGNPIYIFLGKGGKIVDTGSGYMAEEDGAPYNNRNDDRVTMQTLEKLVETKDEVIGLLKSEIARLKEERKRGRLQN